PGGAAAGRAGVPSHDRGERLRQSERGAVGGRAAEGIARAGGGCAPAARRSARAKAVNADRGLRPMPTLSRDEIDRRMKGLTGWTLDGDAIRKLYTFARLPAA